jgi:UDP-N-acetylmuramyl pentapeptide synthase
MKARLRRLTAGLFEAQARRLFRKHHFKIVGIAGAVGKTSTKLAVATVLRQKYRVLVQHGSFNDEIGLPLACFNIPLPAHIMNPFSWTRVLIQMEWRLHRPFLFDVLVIEIGTDSPGEIPHKLTYLKPQIGVITAVAPEHMEFFPGGLDQVAEEELSLADSVKTVVVNEDAVPSKYRKQYLAKHSHVIGYGAHAQVHWDKQAIVLDRHKIPVEPHVIGSHMLLTLLAAAAVASELDLSDEQIAGGVAKVHPTSGRMNPLPGLNGTQLIDDTYNSSPAAVVAALTTLAKFPGQGRRIAVLGSMNELGTDAPRYHEEVGAYAAAVDLLVTVGELANKHLGPAAVRAGLDPTRFRPADSPAAAGNYLKSMLIRGDVVLIKGSQNAIFTEETTKLLLASSVDAKKLVRQSPAWLRRKRKQFPDMI